MFKKISYLLIFMFLIILASNYTSYAELDFKLIYVVQEGDTLSEIADKYNISVDKIKEINNISKNTWIKTGDELIIPNSDKKNNDEWDKKLFSDRIDDDNDLSIARDTKTYSIRVNKNKEKPEVKVDESQLIEYHVSVGDTLYDLAKDFNTSTGVIMAINDLENSSIRSGDKLKIPVNNLSEREVLSKTIKDKELEMLAKIIYGEARGEPYIGQVAVGAVVINRVLSSYFPDNFQEVIYQSGQFTAVADGQINLSPTSTAYSAARDALAGKDPTMGSLYYYNPNTAENKWWFADKEHVVTIGDHVFAR
ncbi:MAG: cell wall hydrolase [Bacillota bacterium]